MAYPMNNLTTVVHQLKHANNKHMFKLLDFLQLLRNKYLFFLTSASNVGMLQ